MGKGYFVVCKQKNTLWSQILPTEQQNICLLISSQNHKSMHSHLNGCKVSHKNFLTERGEDGSDRSYDKTIEYWGPKLKSP